MLLQVLKYVFFHGSYLTGNYIYAKKNINKYKSILTTMYLTFDFAILMDVLELEQDTMQFIGSLWTVISFLTILSGSLLILASAKICQDKMYVHGFRPFRGGIYEHLTDPFYYGKALLLLGISINNQSLAGVLTSSFLYALSNMGVALVEKNTINAWITNFGKRRDSKTSKE
eukprot:NODE_70_length_23697_cov_0.294771.p10 type:complete len:172 gc:universal NODE_70_length_23697_cov_0.294771:19391-19906(+)